MKFTMQSGLIGAMGTLPADKPTVEQLVIAELDKRKPYGFDGDVTADTDLGDLRLDCLDEIEVIMEIEERLSIALPDEWPTSIGTAGDLIAWMEELAAKKSEAA